MYFIIQVYMVDDDDWMAGDDEWVDVAVESNAPWAIRRAKYFEKQYNRVRVVKQKERPFLNEGELDQTSFD